MLTQAAGADGAHFGSLLVFLEDLGAPVSPSGCPGGGLKNGWALPAAVCVSVEPTGPRAQDISV